MTQLHASQVAFKYDLTSRAKLVYIYLASRTNKENTCFPAIKTIAKECGIAVSTVKRAMTDLVAVGLLVKNVRFRENNSQTSNLYMLSENIVEIETQDCNVTECENATPTENIAEDIQVDNFDATDNKIVKVFSKRDYSILTRKVQKICYKLNSYNCTNDSLLIYLKQHIVNVIDLFIKFIICNLYGEPPPSSH